VLGSTEGDEFLPVYRSPAVDVYAADGGGDAALAVDLDLGAVVGDAPARPLRIELFGGPAVAGGGGAGGGGGGGRPRRRSVRGGGGGAAAVAPWGAVTTSWECLALARRGARLPIVPVPGGGLLRGALRVEDVCVATAASPRVGAAPPAVARRAPSSSAAGGDGRGGAAARVPALRLVPTPSGGVGPARGSPSRGGGSTDGGGGVPSLTLRLVDTVWAAAGGAGGPTASPTAGDGGPSVAPEWYVDGDEAGRGDVDDNGDVDGDGGGGGGGGDDPAGGVGVGGGFSYRRVAHAAAARAGGQIPAGGLPAWGSLETEDPAWGGGWGRWGGGYAAA